MVGMQGGQQTISLGAGCSTGNAIHEIGHAIGLDHPTGRGHIMSFRYSEKLDGLSGGDIAGAAYVYGARLQTRQTREERDRTATGTHAMAN